MRILENLFPQLLILTTVLLIMACNPEEVNPSSEITPSSYKIENPTIWKDKYEDPEKADYLIKRFLYIKSKLTIEPGVVVAFEEDGYIKVDCNGSLTALGTENKHITFRGEESNEGFWKGIEINSSYVRNKLNYCDILHTGKGDYPPAAIKMSSALEPGFNPLSHRCYGHLQITNCTIKEASGYGIIAYSGQIDSFYNNHISVNGKAAISTSKPTLFTIDEYSVLEANEGIGMEFSYLYHDNSGFGELKLKKLKGNPAYLMNGELGISGVNKPRALIISKGVEIRFSDNASLSVYDNGYISAIGTADEPIIFTGTNISGPQWNGIHISSDDERNKLEYCEITYGGANIFEYDGDLLTSADSIQTNVFLGTAWANNYGNGPPRLILNSCIVGESGGCGIQIQEGALLTQSNNTFVNNQGGDICEL
jgi:hypothetical protein